MTEMTKSPIDTSLLSKKTVTPSSIQGVCVYCGSGKGVNLAYTIAARKLGKALGDHGIRLIYGGGSLGLMGEVARALAGKPQGALRWSQLGRHSKPIVIANIEGFWDPFLKLLEHMKGETFIRPGLDVHFAVVDKVEKILPAIFALAEPQSRKVDQTVATKF